MVNISLKNITFYSKDLKKILLNDISLDIKAGEFITLVSSANNGKTQLLRIIAGLEKPDSGTVLFNKEELKTFSPNYEKLAMVFRSQALYPHLTVQKNLEFGLKIANLQRKIIESRVAEAADLLGLNNILNSKPDVLSNTQKQLVAIARAFVKHPQVLIFDNPISELDPQSKIKIQSLIRRFCINLEGTIIYSTNNPSEAMTLGDRIVYISDGIIQQVGTSDELYNLPANETVARFIGYPEMNFIEFETGSENNQPILNLFNASYSIDVPKKFTTIIESYPKAKIGVRAENLKISSEKPSAIPMIVEMQEYAGSQSVLHISRERQTLSVEVPLNKRYELGETVYVELPENEVHLFANGKLVI